MVICYYYIIISGVIIYYIIGSDIIVYYIIVSDVIVYYIIIIIYLYSSTVTTTQTPRTTIVQMKQIPNINDTFHHS